jgi:hypothetical protein
MAITSREGLRYAEFQELLREGMDSFGEDFEVIGGGGTYRARGLKNTEKSTGRRYVGFFAGTTVEPGDTLIGVTSRDQMHVTDVESQMLEGRVLQVKAFFAKKDGVSPPPKRRSVAYPAMQGRGVVSKFAGEEDSDLRERIYDAGDTYGLYRDIKTIVAAARASVWVVEPYPDEELFDLYFAKCGVGVCLRFLTRQPSASFNKVITKFRMRAGVQLEVRASRELHDRVILIDDLRGWVVGQSFKDAAKGKPTYLKQVESVADVKRQYEGIWARSAVV